RAHPHRRGRQVKELAGGFSHHQRLERGCVLQRGHEGARVEGEAVGAAPVPVLLQRDQARATEQVPEGLVQRLEAPGFTEIADDHRRGLVVGDLEITEIFVRGGGNEERDAVQAGPTQPARRGAWRSEDLLRFDGEAHPAEALGQLAAGEARRVGEIAPWYLPLDEVVNGLERARKRFGPQIEGAVEVEQVAFRQGVNPWVYWPRLVVIRITPLPPRMPYSAVEAASFRISIRAMSAGFNQSMPRPRTTLTGWPSTT